MCEIIEDIAKQRDLCDKHRDRLEVLLLEQQSINDQVQAASQKPIDIADIQSQRSRAIAALSKTQKQLQGYEAEYEAKMSQIGDLEFLLPQIDEQARHAQEEMNTYNLIVSQISVVQPEVKKLVRRVDNLQSKIDMLHDHEYDPDCEFCRNNEFVKAAEQAKIDIVNVREKKTEKASELTALKLKGSLFDSADLRSKIENYSDTMQSIADLQAVYETLELKIKNAKSQIQVNNQKIERLDEDIAYYNENVEAYENLESLRRDLQAITKTVDLKKSDIKKCDDKVLGYMSEKGSATRAIEEAREKIEKIKEAERDYIAYDVFVQATHANGISYEVIKSMLPVINAEIQKILSPIVEFNVFFDNEADKLEIYLQHPKYDPRPLSMGSGAEKTIASMAVRLALVSVSSLPKSQVFILDEPATALDADHMEGFVRLLQMIKSQFKTVLLITHLESLKDVVDTTIEIDKVDGYAKVNL